MRQDPFFIIGTERSGSNLLRLLLNTHSRIVVPHPPHIMRYFAGLERGYGDLTREANWRALASDVRRLVRAHIYPWERDVDLQRLMAEARPRDLLGLYLGVYEQAREWAGKPRWGCKSTFMLDQVDRVLAHLPGAKFILLVRDPRDVAASSKSSVFNPFHPYFTARLWAEQQEKGRRLLERLRPAQIRKVSYESLVSRPEEEVRALCDFLEEPFEPGMLRYFETQEAKKSSALSASWARTGEPIRTDHAGGYRSRISEEEVRIVEAVAGEQMIRFGYALDHPDAPRDRARYDAQRSRFLLEDRALRARTEAQSLLHDRNHWRRWRRGLLVSWLAMRRAGRPG